MPIQSPDYSLAVPRSQPSIADLIQQAQQTKLQQQAITRGDTENQEAALNLQEKQIQHKDTQAMSAAMHDWDGSKFDDLIPLAMKHGASVTAIIGLKQKALEVKQKYSAIAKDDAETGAKNIETLMKRNDLVSGELKNLRDNAPDDQLPQAILSTAQRLSQQGLLDPEHVQMAQQLSQANLPPDQLRKQLDFFRKGYMADSQQLTEAKEEADAASKRAMIPGQQAKSAQDQFSLAAQTLAPSRSQLEWDSRRKFLQGRLDPEIFNQLPQQYSPDAVSQVKALGITPQQQSKESFEKLTYDDWVAKPENAGKNRADFDKWQKSIAPTLRFDLGGNSRNQLRADKSYQFSSTQLDSIGKPIQALVDRLGRLKDTIAQNSPQADALVAPELMTVMAGGQGSGLRMNEAEIARIVGGRSNWEALKAASNKWSLDPKAANSITPAQRQQIRSLVQTVDQKLIAKQNILDDTRQKLIDSDDPREHRQILADARKRLSEIDQGSQSATDLPDGGGKVIDKATGLKFYEAAGRDPNKAQQLATQYHWKVQ